MIEFQPEDYGSACSQLIHAAASPPLGPGTPQTAARDMLKELSAATVLDGRKLGSQDMAQCCLAALWLLHNYLDESHSISQAIHTSSGSYWHGLMHRREPDYSNSKYWFRQVGDHPIFPDLCQGAAKLAGSSPPDSASRYLLDQLQWDPYRFIDLCQSAHGTKTELESLCRSIADLEWRLLFDDCYQRAAANGSRKQ